jgi:hypothetical protein
MFRNISLRLLTLPLALIAAFVVQAQGQQNNEVGLVIGATASPTLGLASGVVTPSQNLSFDSSFALGAEYDRRLKSGNTAIYVGVDCLASPLDVKLNKPPAGTSPSYAYVFLSPHVRVKFKADGAVQPWLLFGGGYTRFHEASPIGDTSFQAGTNTGNLEFGGGIDTAPIIHVFRIPLGARIEVRDFYSGTPNFNGQLSGSRLNTVSYTGGLLLRF